MSQKVLVFIVVILFELGITAKLLRGTESAPVIGILSQPVDEWAGKRQDYIVTTYANWVREAGGIPIVLHWHWSDEKMKEVVSSINGILLPGGNMTHYDSRRKPTRFVEVQGHLMKLVREAFDSQENQEYIPLWGTCQGFEHMLIHLANSTDILHLGYDSGLWSQKVKVTDEGQDLRMMKGITPMQIFFMKRNPTAFYNHEWATPYEEWKKHESLKDVVIMGYSNDKKGREFIAGFEHRRYPLYGVQFHPEITVFSHSYETAADHEIPKSIMREFAKFLVSEARRNNRKFKTVADLEEYILDTRVKTQKIRLSRMPVYIFE